MLTGFHSGASGIYYNEQKLAVTSHNLANVDTSGFRNSYLMFRTREANDLAKSMDSTIKDRLPDVYGTERSGVFRNYEQTGELKQTGNAMDVAIPNEHSNAFFAVKRTDPLDPNIYYTRNGRLTIGPQDPANPNSPSVLYMAGHIALDGGMQPIPIDSSLGPLEIGIGGEIHQGETVVGELTTFRLDASQDPTAAISADLQELVQLGESLFKVPDQKKQEFHPHPLQVGQAGIDRTVIQGMRERSNVNVFHELVDMMDATKATRANQQAMSRQADSLGKLFQIVRS